MKNVLRPVVAVTLGHRFIARFNKADIAHLSAWPVVYNQCEGRLLTKVTCLTDLNERLVMQTVCCRIGIRLNYQMRFNLL